MSKIINKYLKKVSASVPNATEFTFRTPLENLLNEMAETGEFTRKSKEVTVIQEPSRKKGIGAPDFLLLNEGGAIIGYVECKKIGENLDDLIESEQIKKYGNLSYNVLLTNYRRFILLQNNSLVWDVDLSTASADTPANKKRLQTLIVDFMSAEIRLIDDSKELAAILAERCKALRVELEKELLDTSEDNLTANALAGLLSAFETTLYHGITSEQFADALAQTATYTLFMAKLKSPLGNKKLDIYGLKQHIPKNFALIRDISGFLENLEDTSSRYLLHSILAVVNAIDREGLIEKSRKTEDDMYLYFYENFLAAYSAKLRQSRGVYYTPPSMVHFIVRATDDILRRDFGKREGLADPKVTALDFAAGTGTFMLEIIRRVLENKSQAKCDVIARNHLLKNIFGFELLIAPYVIAHLKLSAFLSDMGVDLAENERINIFLSNTLENNPPQPDLPTIIPALTEEVKRAHEVKEQNILVITGNPPYSGHGQAAGKEFFYRPGKKDPNRQVKDVRKTWIGELLKDYYKVDGKPLGEANPKWLQDDYVKFIRFAQHRISEAGQGIVAIITNHGFLGNPTFRGMRKSLMDTFDYLYFLDMHGNSRIRETAPDGGADENIFDIQQGVVVSLLIKKNAKEEGVKKGVFRADIWGKRVDKENACLEQTVNSLQWEKLEPVSPSYLFVPQNKKVRTKYEKFYPLTDIFSNYSTGILTARDSLTIHFNKEEIKATAKKFAAMPTEEARASFELGKDSEWEISLAQKDLLESGLKDENYRPIAYRPFDIRHTYYTGKSRGFHCRPRDEIMRHMIAGNNIGLISVRRVPAGTWQHVFVTDNIMEAHYGREINYIFPLYCYENVFDEIISHENFDDKFRNWIDNRYGIKHTPEDILGCIYAVLHAPDYRQQYAESLRFDYPRIPFPKDNKSFSRLAKIGNELMNVHLLRTDFDNKIELGGDGKSHIVERVRYNENKQRLYFNEDEYLAQVTPEVFDFKIGGYKPLEKFLKSRKGRNIIADIDALEKAANAVAFTVNAVKKITVL